MSMVICWNVKCNYLGHISLLEMFLSKSLFSLILVVCLSLLFKLSLLPMKLKNLLLFTFCLLFINGLKAQDHLYEWVRTIGGTLDDSPSAITSDNKGDLYVTGYFGGLVDFDPGTATFNLTSNGASDIFIQRLDANGNLVWVKQIGGIFDDFGGSIAVDGLGNVYSTGLYNSSSVDFDPGPNTNNLPHSGLADAYILKLDGAGNFLWAKRMGGSGNDIPTSITLDDNGNIYTLGFFQSTVDFDPGTGISNLTSNGGYDIFIQKLDSSGNFVWVKQIGGINDDYGYKIFTNSFGDIYLTGSFQDTVDFDPGAGTTNFVSHGGDDIFIQKLNAAGNLVWVRQIGGISNDGGNSITIDAIGNILVTGFFQDTVDFDPGVGATNLVSNGEEDIFIQKFDTAGNFVWVKQMGGINDDRGISIDLDSIGNIYTSGSFESTVDFDPGASITNLISSGMEDIFIQKLDTLGNFSWIKQIGSRSTVRVGSIHLDRFENIYTVGNFRGAVDFNPGPGIVNIIPRGLVDIFIQKLQPCLNISVTQSIDSLYANDNNASYQWVDCGSAFSAIPGATNQGFKPNSSGNYAVVLTRGACRDTSACFTILVTGVSKIEGNNSEFIIYPNPTKNIVNIEMNPDFVGDELRLLDQSGRLVLQQRIQSKKEQINVSTLINGIYFIQYRNEFKKLLIIN